MSAAGGAGRDDRWKQWDPETASPVNRWFLEKVIAAPGGGMRLMGFVFLGFTVLFAVITAWVLGDPDSLQSDREFWPFITPFFGVFTLIFFGGWLVAHLRARRAHRRRR